MRWHTLVAALAAFWASCRARRSARLVGLGPLGSGQASGPPACCGAALGAACCLAGAGGAALDEEWLEGGAGRSEAAAAREGAFLDSSTHSKHLLSKIMRLLGWSPSERHHYVENVNVGQSADLMCRRSHLADWSGAAPPAQLQPQGRPAFPLLRCS